MGHKIGYSVKHLKLFHDHMSVFTNKPFNHLELTVDHVNTCSLFFEDSSLKNTLRRTDDFSLSVHSYGGLNLAEKVDKVRKTTTEIVRDLLHISEELSASYFVTHLGYCGFHSDTQKRKQRLDLVIEEILNLLDSIKDSSIQLAIENSVHLPYNQNKSYICDCIEDFDYIFSRIDSSKLGIVFDVGHYHVNNSHFSTEFISEFSDRIIAYHLHWNDGVTDQHRPVTKNWVNENAELYHFLQLEMDKQKVMLFENHTPYDICTSCATFMADDQYLLR